MRYRKLRTRSIHAKHGNSQPEVAMNKLTVPPKPVTVKPPPTSIPLPGIPLHREDKVGDFWMMIKVLGHFRLFSSEIIFILFGSRKEKNGSGSN